MPNDLRILFPSASHDDQHKPLPSTFLAMGLVRPVVVDADRNEHKVRTVQARVQHYVDGDLGNTVAKEKTRFLRPWSSEYLLWAVVLKKTSERAPTRARLTVEAYEKGNNHPVASATVDLWLRPPDVGAEPTIDWPDMDDYQIEGDERSYFVTWGGSDLPITSVTLGAASATNVEWYEEDDFWWATFNPGSAPGSGNDHALRVSNADDSATRVVDVA